MTKFDDVELKNAQEWMCQKTKPDFACACCGVNDYQVKRLQIMLTDDSGNYGYPHLLIVCQNCGNSLLFSTQIMDIVNKNKCPNCGDEECPYNRNNRKMVR